MSESEQSIKRVTRCGDDYYAILGIAKGASDDEIKKAYRKLALRLHPDKCQDPGAEEAFKRVGEAFSVLSDSDKREVYDRHGAEGLKGRSGGGSGGINPEDIFEAFFGGQGFPGGATFVQRGGGGGGNFQTFSFSTGGPSMGGIHFSSGSPFMGGQGVRRGAGGVQAAARRQAQQEEEEREAQEVPAWLKGAQGFAGALGPLLPIAIVALMGLMMMMLTTIISFFVKRAFILLPIMYLTEGRVKMILISSIVLLSVFGIM